MCDYSLHHVATRPAKVGDKLVTTKFNNSITRGFAGVGDPHVAVCLLPGTEIAFEQNVECEPSFGIGILPNKKTGQRLARFRQINMDNAVTHHDALEFPDGQVVLLTRLCDGQRATVLQMPASARPAGGGGCGSRPRGRVSLRYRGNRARISAIAAPANEEPPDIRWLLRFFMRGLTFTSRETIPASRICSRRLRTARGAVRDVGPGTPTIPAGRSPRRIARRDSRLCRGRVFEGSPFGAP